MHVRVLEVVLLLETIGLSAEFETKVPSSADWKEPEPLVGWDFCGPAPTGPRHSHWCWTDVVSY